jgi:nucleoside-diphosphate-sugar epimerase
MTRILVTGASGFIGSNLTRNLVNTKDQIHILIRNQSNLWRLNDIISGCNVHFVDISKIDEVRTIISEVKPEIVYHCAAFGVYPNQKDASLMNQINVNGTSNLLTSLHENSELERLINLGSVFEYGFTSNSIKETDPTRGQRGEPFDSYSDTKVSQTRLVEHYSHQKQLPAVTLRIFTPYGIFEEPGRLISDVMVATVKKKPLEIFSRKAKRDFVHIDDVVNALIKASKKSGIDGEIFNIGSGTATSVEDLVNLVCEVTDVNLEVSWYDEKQREDDKTGTNGFADLQKVKKIDWKPEVSLKDGLSRTYNWFLENIKLY